MRGTKKLASRLSYSLGFMLQATSLPPPVGEDKVPRPTPWAFLIHQSYPPRLLQGHPAKSMRSKLPSLSSRVTLPQPELQVEAEAGHTHLQSRAGSCSATDRAPADLAGGRECAHRVQRHILTARQPAAGTSSLVPPLQRESLVYARALHRRLQSRLGQSFLTWASRPHGFRSALAAMGLRVVVQLLACSIEGIHPPGAVALSCSSQVLPDR